MTTMQNLATLTLTDDQLIAVDAALAELEKQLGGLIGLTTTQKQQATKMGEKSEAFCRQTLHVLSQNPQVLPSNVDLADSIGDLRASDLLKPRLVRLSQLYQRAIDTDLALRSDVMVMALYGYRLLKVTGRGAGLEPLQQELRNRFGRSRRSPAAKARTPEVG